MIYLVVLLFIIGIVLLVVGYRKNSRNLLLAGAIVLFVSATVQPFSQGFAEGFREGSSGQAAAWPE